MVSPMCCSCLYKAILQFDLGGHDLTQCLMRMLTKSGYSFSTMDEQEVITYTIGEVVLCNSGV